MVDAQGGPEYDRHTGRHVFKKLSRFLENPHVERSIRAKFAQGGSTRMGCPRFAAGGSTGYSMPQRSPMGEEQFARGGDTDLVYITPHMKRLFDSIGAGSTNPVNGKPEYFGLSDIWSGVKNYGAQGLGMLNQYAPQIANALKPEAAGLGEFAPLAEAALTFAPAGISALNNYVNPKVGPKEMPNGYQAPLPDIDGQQQEGPLGMPKGYMPADQRFGRFVGNFANQFNNPAAQGIGAAGTSYANNGGNFPKAVEGGVNVGTSGNYSPAANTARAGAQMYGSRAPMRNTLSHMGHMTINQMLGNNSNDMRRAQSQMIDQANQQQQPQQNQWQPHYAY